MGQGIDLRTELGEGQDPRPAQYEFVLTTDVAPSRVYASRGSDGRVFRSDDRGETWRNVLFQSMKTPEFNVGPNYLIDERGGGGDTISGFGINPADPDNVIVADWMDCYITRNGGKSWETAHTRSAEEPGRRGKGMRWIHTGLVVTTAWNYYLDPFEPNRHYIAYTDIGFARSTDAGKTWYWQHGKPLRNTTYELAFDPETPGTIWGAFADLHDIPNNNVISGRHYFAGVWGRRPQHGLRRNVERYLQGTPSQADHFRHRRSEKPAGEPDTLRLRIRGGRVQVDRRRQELVQVVERPGLAEDQHAGLPDHPPSGWHAILPGDCAAEGPPVHRRGPRPLSIEGRRQDLGMDQPVPAPPLAQGLRRRSPRQPRHLPRCGGCRQGGRRPVQDERRRSQLVSGRAERERLLGAQSTRKPDWVYLCIAEGDDEPGLWLSQDAGKTWKALEGMPFRNAQRVTFDPRDDAIIYVSTFGGSICAAPGD